MRNSKNKRTHDLQELKAIAKSAYSITNKANLSLNYSKISKSRKKDSKLTSKIFTNQSSIIERRSNSKKSINATYSFKQRFDDFVRRLFIDIDFDCSGFITTTKISYYKQMPEPVFYFFGGIFQKIKQLGGVT